MNVHDFGGDHKVDSRVKLERILRSRFEGETNEFLLSHGSSTYPLISIFVKGDLAVIYYIPGEGQAGYASIGKKMNLNPNTMTSFATGTPENIIDVSNEAVVSFSEAVEVAKEFFDSQVLPTSIEWLKL